MQPKNAAALLFIYATAVYYNNVPGECAECERGNSSGQLILNNNYRAPCSMDALDLRVNENRVP
jgi:hypothetical protein